MNAGVNYRLLTQHLGIVLLRNIDIGKDLDIRLPADDRSGTLLPSAERSFGKLGDRLAFPKGDLEKTLSVIRLYVHILGRILRSARAESVQTERILIARAVGIVVVFTARIQLAVDKLPVISAFALVVAERNASAVVLYLNGVIEVNGCGYRVAVALARLVDSIRQYLEYRMLTALETVRAEDDRRSLAHPVGALQRRYTAVIIDRVVLFDLFRFCGCCHPFLLVLLFFAACP